VNEHPTPKTDGSAGPPLIVPAAPPATGANSAVAQAATATSETSYRYDHPCAAHPVIVDAETADVRVDVPRKKIAVCGFASSSRHLMPLLDPTWEIWGMNQLYRHIPRGDRWFDIHWNWDTEVVEGTDHRGWMQSCGIPVYMMQTHPDIPTSVRFPLERLVTLAGDYFTSTVAFMTALAVLEVDRLVLDELTREAFDSPADVLARQTELYRTYTIGLFGIDLVVGEEYFDQKPCAEFWLGMAVGRGISVYIPPQSALLKQAYRYGYEAEPAQWIKPREIDQHREELTKKREELIKALYLHDGALQSDEYWRRLVELRSRGAEVRL
jgi:hypothetical protein